MRRQNDAAGVAGPVHHVERGIVLGKIGIAAVAEDALHEIQIAHQAGGREEPDLHRSCGIGPGSRDTPADAAAT